MKDLILDAKWTLNNRKYKNIPATVPGCVHTDLLNNKLIPDYFWRDNNKECQWIENEDWAYSCSFDFADFDKKTKLVFDGLDTYSDIYLNGIHLGETHNMFISHSFDVSGIIKQKDNQLEVRFRSPIKEVEGCPCKEAAFTYERLYSRRMQCTYSWDWVDRFVTCGIFRPVHFIVGDYLMIKDTYVYTANIDDFGAQVVVSTNFINYDKPEIVKFEILSPQGDIVYKNSNYIAEDNCTLRINVKNPQLWWPNGYGEHPIYTLKITTANEVYNQTFGIRTARIAEVVDDEGSEYSVMAKEAQKYQRENIEQSERSYDKTQTTAGFLVIINGKRIYCRGANWVPCSPFPSQESDEKISEIIELTAEGNMNMIRVWGGGIFEKDTFYDQCDKNGILVTQDFLMACGEYPQNEQWFIEELKKESEYVAKKLRNHPCLVWWSGDNENAVYGYDTSSSFWGREAALKGIAPALLNLDYSRQFLQSSPYGGTPYMSMTRGTTHNTNLLGNIFRYFLQDNNDNYKEFFAHFLARFIAEEPIFGAPQTSSLLRFMPQEDLDDLNEDIYRFHSKDNPSIETPLHNFMKSFAKNILGDFTSTQDRLFKYEYIQYEWLRVVTENCRRNLGYNDGIIFWMLNDCWPASSSWSIIDFYNLPKAAFYSIKRCGKSVVGSIDKVGNNLVLYVSSDKYCGNATVLCQTKQGELIKKFDVNLNAYSVEKITLPHHNEKIIICDVLYENNVDRTFYKDGPLPIIPTGDFEIINQTENNITIKAKEYIHSLALQGDYIYSDNYFSLLKDQVITIDYRKASIASTDCDLPTVIAYTIKF